jgi:hypothetical protein
MPAFNSRSFSIAVALLLFSVLPPGVVAQTIADTPENRQREADRYLQTMSPQELFAGSADKAAKNIPPAERQRFMETLSAQFDFDALSKAMTAAMVKHFTAEELKELADLYSSPTGKSAKSKFGAYMSEVMAAVQTEMTKAEAKVNRPSPAGLR